MNIYLLTLIATVCNVGTIACIKKCKHAIGVGGSVLPWVAGIFGAMCWITTAFRIGEAVRVFSKDQT